ncbi:MAG: Uma2 family endonuclease [Planctomycetaceae bacterium]
MSTAPKGLSIAQYLDLELRTGQRHEYFLGEVFAMVGGSPRHSLIATNFSAEARQRLIPGPCVAYNSDLRIKVSSNGLYTYPDATIICGELQLDSDIPDTVVNPTVLAEVLSDSTEHYDRGRKAMWYRSIPSLNALVLISQDRPHVECFTRQTTGGLLLTEATELTDTLVLKPLGISIPLAEIYRNVQFQTT